MTATVITLSLDGNTIHKDTVEFAGDLADWEKEMLANTDTWDEYAEAKSNGGPKHTAPAASVGTEFPAEKLVWVKANGDEVDLTSVLESETLPPELSNSKDRAVLKALLNWANNRVVSLESKLNYMHPVPPW